LHGGVGSWLLFAPLVGAVDAFNRHYTQAVKLNLDSFIVFSLDNNYNSKEKDIFFLLIGYIIYNKYRLYIGTRLTPFGGFQAKNHDFLS